MTRTREHRPRQPLALERFDRRRLDAESIRDAMLAVSGQLDRRRPMAASVSRRSRTGTGPSTMHSRQFIRANQRSVFLMTQRLVKHPFLAIFDGPDTNTSTDVRPRLDRSAPGPLPDEQPVHPGAVSRVWLEGCCARTATFPGALERAWELAWGRPPSPTGKRTGVPLSGDVCRRRDRQRNQE